MNRTAFFAGCLILAFALPAGAATLTVGKGIGYNYSTIQAAIDAAAIGDTILVHPATYVENINFKGKDIVLRSTNPADTAVVAATIIDGNSSGSVVTFAGTETSSCALAGFTIRNGRANEGGGIVGYDEAHRYRMETHARIEYNIITANRASSDGGGIARCRGIICNNGIRDNSAGDDGGGLVGCNGTIQSNVVARNGAMAGGGLAWCSGVISGNSIVGNSGGYGGGIYGCDGVIRDNMISANKGGAWAGGLGSCSATISGNTVSDNTSGGDGAGLWSCHGPIRNNQIVGNASGSRGGGLYWCEGEILGNTIARNRAWLEGQGCYNCPGEIRNCIVWGNGEGPQLVHSSTPKYSCIQNWAGGGLGNIGAAPLFTTGPLGPYYLSQTAAGQAVQSPCVDAGYGTAFEAGMKERTTRTDLVSETGIVDMGFHYSGAVPAPPIIAARPETVWLTVWRGTRTASCTIDVWNAGGGTLAYEIAAGPPWFMRVTPASGHSDGEKTSHLLTADLSSSPPLPLLGSIALTGNAANAPLLIPVEIRVVPRPNIITVGKGHAYDFQTIQDGIDAATTGNQVVVYPATYIENIHLKGKSIVLRSTNPTDSATVARTIIDGNLKGSVVTFMGTETEACVVSGFVIRNGDAGPGGYGGGILGGEWTARSRALIENNQIVANFASLGGGLMLCDGTITSNAIRQNFASIGAGLYGCHAAIQGNAIMENSAGYDGGGLAACDGRIWNNLIVGNSARSWGGGLYECGGAIECNTIVANSANDAGGGVHSCGGTIANCIIWANTGTDSPYQVVQSSVPLYSCIQGWIWGGIGNINADPLFTVGPLGEYYLSQTAASQAVQSPCVDAGSTTALAVGLADRVTRTDRVGDSGIVDLGYHYPRIRGLLIVRKGGGSEFATIQAAIDAAFSGDTILVHPATYVENINFKGKNITLRSNDPTSAAIVATTIIDGNSSGSVVTFAGTETSSCALAGFTIRNGSSTQMIQFPPTYCGGGIFGRGTHARIENNVITDNYTGWPGVSGRARTTAERPFSEQLVPLQGSGSGGGIYKCHGVIRNNTITRNSASGPTVGQGGGLSLCNGLIEHNTVAENRADTGDIMSGGAGGGFFACNGTIRDNLISGNRAVYGSALASCNAAVVNNTLADNQSAAGQACVFNCKGPITNCIIWNNAVQPGLRPLDQSTTPTYSCLQNWTGGGVGNISADPLFTTGSLGPYYLSQFAAGQSVQSPCVDAGSSSALALGLADRTTRTDGLSDAGIADMGYHHSIPRSPQIITVGKTGGSFDFSIIQAAIDATTTGDTVVVYPATYVENINFRGKSIILRSTDPVSTATRAATIIDGNAQGPVVTFAGTETASCVLTGFTIRNGFSIAQGAGVCGQGTHARIEYNIITGSAGYAFGSGLARCDGIIRNNEIVGNGVFGSGGGLANCNGLIEHNSIRDNFADHDGAGIYNCDGVIRNNLIFYNGVDWLWGRGSGLAFCDGLIENNTVAANRYGSALFYCQGTIRNCIIWGNLGVWYHGTYYNLQLSECSVPTFSCIEDWSGGGEGNISADPLFTTGPLSPCYLSQTAAGQSAQSPCVDAGSSTALALGLAGRTTRTDGGLDQGVVDLGYHYAPLSPPPALAVTPARFDVAVVAGAQAPNQTLQVRNVGDSAFTLHYVIASSARLVTVFSALAASSGETNTHQVFFDTRGLGPGIHNDTLIVSSQWAPPVSVPVQIVVSPSPLPNLILAHVDFAPSAPLRLQPGEPLALSALIENVGPADAGPFWTEVWGSRSGGFTLDRFLAGSLRLPGLSGSGGAFSWITTSPLYSIPDGAYSVVYAVDRPSQVAESNERDNRAVVRGKRLLVARPQTRVDLVVEQFDLSPDPAMSGQPIRLAGRVANRGTERSGPFWVEFWGSWETPFPAPNFFLCDSIAVMDLDASATLDLSVYSRTLYNVPAGSFQLGCVVDRDDSINELDETNNYQFVAGRRLNTTVFGVAESHRDAIGPPRIELFIADVAPTAPTRLAPGDATTLTVGIHNPSQFDLRPFWLEYWVSRDGGLTVCDFLTDSDRVPWIQGGGTWGGRLSKRIYSLPDGPYTVVVWADRLGENPPNVYAPYGPRVAIAGKRVIVERPQGRANLTLENFTPAQGTWPQLALGGTVRNTGAADSGPFWIEFWASPGDPDYPDFNRFACDSIHVNNLAPGGVVNLADYARTFYDRLPPGQCMVTCFVDRLDQVIETDETDNYASIRGVIVPPH